MATANPYTLAGPAGVRLLGGRYPAGNSTLAGGAVLGDVSASGAISGHVVGDWAARSSGAGVVWAHDFSNAAEISRFLVGSTGPSQEAGNVAAVGPRKVTDDEIGPCMEIIALGARLTSTFDVTDTVAHIDDATHWPASDFYVHFASGTYDISGRSDQQNNLFYVTSRTGTALTVVYQSAYEGGFQPFATSRRSWPAGTIVGHQTRTWGRPFSAMTGDSNGRGVDDVNNAGVALRSSTIGNPNYVPTGQIWGYGWYGRSEYQSTYANWTPTDDGIARTGVWDGDEFYIQFRIKVDPRFWRLNVPAAGKKAFGRKTWILDSQYTLAQEIVGGITPSDQYQIPFTAPAPFAMAGYSFGGGLAGRSMTDQLASAPGEKYQPGSPYDATALLASVLQVGQAWEPTPDKWQTFLLRMKPGLDWIQGDNVTARNTLLEVKVAEDGGPYVTLYSVTDQAICYGSTGPREHNFVANALPGYNGWRATGYLNIDLGNAPPTAAYYVRFGQVIFSKAPIPAPSELPSWVPAAGDVATLTVANGGLANNVRDVIAPYYESFWSVGLWNDYSSVTPNEHWGRFGGNVAFGGGHSSTNDNSVLVEEFGQSAITVKRVTNPTAWAGTGTDSTTKNSNASGNQNAFVDATYGESTIDGQPCSNHSYSAGIVIGPQFGGAQHGTFFRPLSAGPNYHNSTPVGSKHHIDFTDTVGPFTWVRTTDAVTSSAAVSTPHFTVFVGESMRTYILTNNNGQAPKWWDHATQTEVTGTGTGFPADADSPDGGAYFYVPARGLLINVVVKTGALVWRWMDVTVAQPTLGGTATLSQPMEALDGWSIAAWVPPINRVVCGGIKLAGSVDNAAVYEVAIPSTLSDPWTVTRKPFPGAKTIPWPVRDCFRKWAYHPKTRSMVSRFYATQAGGQDTVYVYRPDGT